jgi:hypothetical protein
MKNFDFEGFVILINLILNAGCGSESGIEGFTILCPLVILGTVLLVPKLKAESS